MRHDEARLVARLAGMEQIADRKPLELVVVARPGGDAMDVGDEFRLRLREKLRKIPEDRMLHRAVDVQPPALARDVRHHAEIEDGPVPGQMLPGRQALTPGALSP